MSLVLTFPGLGAFAIMTKLRFVGEKLTEFWPEDSMRERSVGTYAGRGVPALRRRKE
jgi:hypothetical protein